MPWELTLTRPAGTVVHYFDCVEEAMAPYVRLRLAPIELLEGDSSP